MYNQSDRDMYYAYIYLCTIGTTPLLVQHVTKIRQLVDGRRQYPEETQNQADIAEWVGEEQDLCAFYADLTRFANLCLNEHVMPRARTPRPPSLSQRVEMIVIIKSKLIIQKDFPSDVPLTVEIVQ